jgi:DNA-binding transcriptional LysR family regulator
MDISRFETFLVVARQRSFTRAARELHLSQSGVSRQVQRLEHELGVPLLLRSRSSVELTPEGERVFVFAEQIVADYARLREELSVAQGGLEGTLRIAASTTPGEFLVPMLLSEFCELHPKVKPEVFSADSAAVIEELHAQRSDIGFVGTQEHGSTLQHDVVMEDEVVLAVPADHPFAEREVIALEELAGQPFIGREEGSGTLASVRETAIRQGLELPDYRVVMVLGTSQGVVTAAEQGYGIGWVSAQPLATRVASRVVAVRVNELDIKRSLYLVKNSRRTLSPVAQSFGEWVLARSWARVNSSQSGL